MDLAIILGPAHIDLRDAFRAMGHDLRLVGGAVRSLLLGEPPADLDFATDADPDQQLLLYRLHGVRHIPTGLKHGTVTVVLDGEPVEITSLRTETDHDGRHASVQWTRDWQADLGRRDLTVNAMAMTLDGDLIDPFGGAADLAAKRIRFVGEPAERMREDYLRILRWLRFHARLAGNQPLDEAAVRACLACREGLAGIARERIWSEVARMLPAPAGVATFNMAVAVLGLAPFIDLPADPDWHWPSMHIAQRRTSDPVALLVAGLSHATGTGRLSGAEQITRLAEAWRWSAEDRERGLFFARWFLAQPDTVDPRAMVARDGIRLEWVVGLCRLRGDTMAASRLSQWRVPVFPVRGVDLKRIGMEPGPGMGEALRLLREEWAASGYVLSRDGLLARIAQPPGRAKPWPNA